MKKAVLLLVLLLFGCAAGPASSVPGSTTAPRAAMGTFAGFHDGGVVENTWVLAGVNSVLPETYLFDGRSYRIISLSIEPIYKMREYSPFTPGGEALYAVPEAAFPFLSEAKLLLAAFHRFSGEGNSLAPAGEGELVTVVNAAWNTYITLVPQKDAALLRSYAYPIANGQVSVPAGLEEAFLPVADRFFLSLERLNEVLLPYAGSDLWFEGGFPVEKLPDLFEAHLTADKMLTEEKAKRHREANSPPETAGKA